MNSDTSSSATSQYHAQLYSGQKQLQKRHQLLQEQKQKQTNNTTKPTLTNYKVLSFDAPNLYQTSLKLTSEIDIHAWWESLVKIFSGNSFYATRIALSIPQDPNDPFTGPWGLKAVYNKTGSISQESDNELNLDTTTEEDEQATISTTENVDYFLHSHAVHETCPRHVPWCFDRLQPFESEPEPLINNPSVNRILKRNSPVVLSREYRRKSSTKRQLGDDLGIEFFKRALLDQTTDKSRKSNWSLPIITTPCFSKNDEILVDGSCLSNEENTSNNMGTFLQDFDEYEQQQPSPWSQSPAPSPAIMDPEINPFFQSPPDIDDDAFNPVSPESYDNSSLPFPPPISNVHSIVHVPLFHPSDVIEHQPSSSSTSPSHLTSYFTTNNHSSQPPQPQPTPIAILSFLAPIVPYPPVLLSSINSLSPFIAASFTNANQNSQMKKNSQFFNRRKSHHDTSDHRPKKRRSSKVNIDLTSPILDHSSATTPTTARPDHLGSMSNFTRSSLETVTAQYPLSPNVTTPHALMDQISSTADETSSVSSYNSSMSSFPPEEQSLDELEQIVPDNLQEPSSRRNSSANLSPSSVAVMEGWGAVSPTTGLPISFSIPPHTMCSDKSCLQHNAPTSTEDDDIQPKTTETEDIAPTPPPITKHVHQKKKIKRKRKYRKNSKLKRQHTDDDGFHYHRQQAQRNGLDQFLVAPKSSLLRLIIDGIPIHVFTCSPSSGQVTWVNNRMLQYTGKSLKDHLGPKWLSHMHPDDQPECKKAWEVAFEQGNGFAGEYRVKRFDGLYRCFLWRIVPLRDLKGKIIHWFGTCTDVHDQHVAKESSLRQVEIESNERKYRLLAEAIPQIVFTFSPSAGLTYTNGKWSSYSGKSFEQTMGLGFMSCVHPEDRSKLQLPDLPPLTNKAGISWQSEVRLLDVNEDYKWFLVKCVSVDELDTGDVRWFGTCTDINDHKLLEKKLKEAHDAAQKSTESKTRFLSNMSHEIRTPLIGITGMLNFLLDTELTAEQMDYVHTIQQSAESLLVVINDILDLSKVEAGMMKLEWEPFSLVTMIEDANELLSTLAIQKSLELSFWIDDDVPDVMVGDRVRLRQVLLNLIGNAIKFTSEGEVFTRCKVELYDREESELTLLFEVVDTGTGFDASEEAVMFKPFSQVDSSSTRKHGGSGLGLVISRQLIELHGGIMKCRSKKGKGSTFYFTAKFGIPTSQTKPLPQTPQNESNHDPFFRSNGYDNSSSSHPPIVEENGPMPFVNKNNQSRFIPSAMAHSEKHSQTTFNTSPADILQDVLMNKAASMQLKPPPVKNNARAESNVLNTAAAATSAVTSLANQLLLPSINQPPSNTLPLHTPSREVDEISSRSYYKSAHESKLKPSIPTIGAQVNATSGVVILPPRTPTRSSPLRALVVSPWKHSRESMEKHVKTILSSIVEKQCTSMNGDTSHYHVDTLTNQIEAIEWLADPYTQPYDYILINLSSEQQILMLTRAVCGSLQQQNANVLVVTTPIQRSLITEAAKGREDQVIPKTCGFVFKPLKRNKLRWYFGVRQEEKVNDQVEATSISLSTVSTPDTPYKRAATQKEIFKRMKADVGGKGFKILLVEDNLVNQKVLTRYLNRVGLNVDVAVHGGECIELFHKHPKDYYCLILCDLFMPVKDGYETTREIREWEKENLAPNEKPKPIVALSANVMSDVANKCLECGFSTYISKPVNFAILSDVIRSYLL